MGLHYSDAQNMLVGRAYTSVAGNTYFKGMRLSDRIYITMDIGIGYAHTFLNSLSIYSNQNGEKTKIVSQEYHCKYYSEVSIKEDAKKLVKEKLISEAKKDKVTLDEEWLSDFTDVLIEDAYKKQIETMKNMQLNKLLTK